MEDRKASAHGGPKRRTPWTHTEGGIAVKSRIAEKLELSEHPVALLWTDEKPEGALQFQKGRWGCAMFLFAAAVRGKTAVVDRETFGCWGGGVGLGFGNRYHDFPGGLDGFYRFLSDGNERSAEGRAVALAMTKGGARPEFVGHFLHGERYRKTPELVKAFVEELPIVDIPARYVVLAPLDNVDPEKDKPVSVTFLVDPDRFSALVVLAHYDRPRGDAVLTPHAAACQMIGILTYAEGRRPEPRCVAGLTDISARKYLEGQVGKDKLTFTIPYARFLEMEADVEGSFLETGQWKALLPSSTK
jgi:uncharacterized protein (DUF169 family)